ncbi:MAG TPA: TetR/AcrR family transcriptional regulator [Spirochaetes bacterium]|nr:TetR/AcrR family transcriptional regulator [Spirochaetota bacterium]
MENERKAGRPRSEEAHQAILSATNRLMEATAVRNVTIEGIAKEAGVGRPTIYRWWDSKCSLVMDAFLDSAAPKIPFPKKKSPVEAIKEQVKRVVKLLLGPSGRIVAEIIGEGQSDAHVLEEFRERFFSKLFAPARAVIEWGKETGELDENLDTDLAMDLIYGPIYYRLLIGHQPLSKDFATVLTERVIMALKPISSKAL